jgi:hypothetical protein
MVSRPGHRQKLSSQLVHAEGRATVGIATSLLDSFDQFGKVRQARQVASPRQQPRIAAERDAEDQVVLIGVTVEDCDERGQHARVAVAAGRYCVRRERIQSLFTEPELDAAGPIGLDRLTRPVGGQVGDRRRPSE